MLWLAAPLVIISVYLVWTRTGFVQSATAQRWKFLFPSWRFFEDVGHRFTLWARNSESQDWVLLRKPLSRHRRLLWVNAEGNLVLALDSLLEQFVIELQYQLDLNPQFSADDIQQMALFKLVDHQAKFLAPEFLPNTSSAAPTQFRICRHWQGDHLMGDFADNTSMEEVFQW